MIVDAVIPLLIEHGRVVTSKQIAEAAGIAEGTIFRAFGDKDTLVAAAIAKYFDPEPLRDALRAIDPALPLDNKIRAMVFLMRERFSAMYQMIMAIGGGRPPAPHPPDEFASIIATALAPDSARLNWPPERVAHIVRLISFAASLPPLNEGVEFSVDDLASIVLTGIAGELRTPAAHDHERTHDPLIASTIPTAIT